jgi:signal peptidase I
MLLSVPYFVASIPIAVGTVYVLKTYCMEAFIIPTNSMAPTFFGWHHQAVCPLCQGKAIIPSRPPNDPDRFLGFPDQSKNGICTQCRKISEFTKWPEEVNTPIRIICNKLMQPKRGDAMVFVFPGNPDPQQKTLYIMRLVGLPGEKIEIKDEAVWVNGDKWSPPPELSGLAYLGRPGFLSDDWAKDPRSWDLGPDDFFVLGDMTTNSSDSRDWGPVPRANIVGVATLIYWPPSALRVLR